LILQNDAAVDAFVINSLSQQHRFAKSAMAP
jgi:hypothetical protein